MDIGGSNLNLARKLQERIKLKKENNGAGISAAFVVGGTLVAACAVGTRGLDGTPADISDLYNIGSITKVYCAAAIMKLVEMGRLRLDETIISYLPQFKMRDERYKKITIRMLLNHSSGLPSGNYRNIISDFWQTDYTLEKLLDYFADTKLKADPGAYSVYCNEGFDLAAAIIEVISGQKFIDFVRQYITDPIGALTTGEENKALKGKIMMSCLGKKPEFLTAIGSGAIHTDLSDCVKFGYLFIESTDVIKKELLDETLSSQGASFLSHDPSFKGLGWGIVDAKPPMIDLGDHAASKDGGTAQFKSLLIISQKYKLSAAISSTIDCKIDSYNLLCELIKIALNEIGYDVCPNIPQSLPTPLKTPETIPNQLINKFEGIYFSRSDIYKIEIRNNRLFVLHRNSDDEWEHDPGFPEMEWDGEMFRADANLVVFEEYNQAIFMIKNNYTFAQKNITYPKLNEGWKNRIGKKYIACNFSAFDEFTLPEIAVNICKTPVDGVIRFSLPARKELTFFALSMSDNDTNMFPNAPGISRDIYAPFLVNNENIEYLKIHGYYYVDTEKVPELKSGKIISTRKEQNAIFKTKSGSKLKFVKPDDVAIYILDDKLSLIHNSHESKPMPEICNGYIVFANDAPMNFDITVT